MWFSILFYSALNFYTLLGMDFEQTNWYSLWYIKLRIESFCLGLAVGHPKAWSYIFLKKHSFCCKCPKSELDLNCVKSNYSKCCTTLPISVSITGQYTHRRDDCFIFGIVKFVLLGVFVILYWCI